MRHQCWTAAALLVMCSVAAAQEPSYKASLAERIQRRPDPTAPFTEIHGDDEISFDMESLLKDADRIVYGRVETMQTTLQADGKNLITRYSVSPIRTLWPRADPGRAPGILSSLDVTKWGGDTTIGGVAVSQIESSFPPFHVGDTLVLALEMNAKTGAYTVVGDRAVFAVENDHVRPWTAHVEYRKYRGMPLAQLESRIQELRSATR